MHNFNNAWCRWLICLIIEITVFNHSNTLLHACFNICFFPRTLHSKFRLKSKTTILAHTAFVLCVCAVCLCFQTMLLPLWSHNLHSSFTAPGLAIILLSSMRHDEVILQTITFSSHLIFLDSWCHTLRHIYMAAVFIIVLHLHTRNSLNARELDRKRKQDYETPEYIKEYENPGICKKEVKLFTVQIESRHACGVCLLEVLFQVCVCVRTSFLCVCVCNLNSFVSRLVGFMASNEMCGWAPHCQCKSSNYRWSNDIQLNIHTLDQNTQAHTLNCQNYTTARNRHLLKLRKRMNMTTWMPTNNTRVDCDHIVKLFAFNSKQTAFVF